MNPPDDPDAAYQALLADAASGDELLASMRRDLAARRHTPPAPAAVPRDDKAAARQRRYRARQRDGELVLPIAIGADFIEALLRSGRISEEAALDRTKLVEATEGLHADWTVEWLK